MRSPWVGAACLLLAGIACAAGAEPKEEGQSANPSTSPKTAVEPQRAKDVPQVSIESLPKPPVCRRHVPTGSRIATQRCTAPQQEITAEQRANDEVMRRDFEALRDLQMAQEQARQAAMREALRRGNQ